MRNRHLYILAAVLTLSGCGLFLYKALFLELPLRPETKVQNWEIEVRLNFTAQDLPVKLSLFIAKNQRLLRVIDQNFFSEGYGLTMKADGPNRRALFSIRKATGEQTIYYRFVVHRSPVGYGSGDAEEPMLTSPRFGDAQMASARGLLRSLRTRSADDETLVGLLLKDLTSGSPSDEAAMLLGLDPSSSKRMAIAAEVLSLTGIPARPVHGVELTNFRRRAGFVHWLEVFIDDGWRAFGGGENSTELSANRFPWWRGTDPVATLEGGSDLRTSVAVSAASVPALRSALATDVARGANLLRYFLFTLPLSTQQVYKIILTVPIGVFLLTFLRNVIGLRTFGTFMPVLIAIAFRETHVVWGIILFTTVVSIGLLVRSYFENLRLLVVPRLASVLIVVVLSMAGISVVSNQIGLQPGLSVALFPMVIMTMTVERMSIIWDERGPAEMMRLGTSSLLVAVVAHLIMVNSYVEHLCFVFPELLLIVLAGNLLLGRYSGYRLLDLPRFRVLAGRTE